MCRISWRRGLMAGLAAYAIVGWGIPGRSFAQDISGPSPFYQDFHKAQVHRTGEEDKIVPPTAVYTTDDVVWDKAVRDLHGGNRLAGTVIISGDRWTPERQAAEPAAFQAALADAQSRVNSPRYQAARKAEADRVNEAVKLYRERRIEEVALDRQERQAKLNFDWNRIAGWQLAANAVPLKLAELDATATANAMALQSTKVSVVQSPGVVARPTSFEVTPEQKTRVVRRFLAGNDSLTQIARDSNVPPQLVRQWVRDVLK